jgi:HEAT repeat protein
MFRRLWCAASWMVVIGFSSPAALAQEATHRAGELDSKAAQRELVQHLGDASYAVRDEAAKELVRQGPAAKDVLTEALNDPDPEIRSRARLTLDRILQAAEAEDTGDRGGDPGPTAAQRELVQQLGAPSFFTRESAAEKLASQGVTAKAALWEALQDSDLEVRWRARRVLSRVRQDEFAARLAAFIAGTDGAEQHDFPGWKRFRDLNGEGRDAREMFAAMMRAEWSLLSAYEKQSPELPALFAGRAAWLQSRAASGNSDACVVPPQTVATLLLIGSDETVKDHSRGLSQLYPLLTNLAAMRPAGLTAHSSIQRTLLETWVTSAASSGSTYGMMVALKYDLEEAGLQQATQFIEQGTKSSSAIHYAIITVGRFGGEEHIRLLTPLLENKTVCHTWSNAALKKNGTIKVEVRDAALVVVLRLSGKDPKDYGFKLLKENPETLYYVYTFGFIDDEERAVAHAKWAAESKADEK